MNTYLAEHICRLEDVKAKSLTIPLITVRPVALNDAAWPICASCGCGVSACECSEYQPLLSGRGL